MADTSRHKFFAAEGYQELLRRVGLAADNVFEDPRIAVWRKLEDRENCVLEEAGPDGVTVKLHIKRYAPVRRGAPPAEVEANGIRSLQLAGIATVPLVGWGIMGDGRSFTITEDLAGYAPADKLVERGMPFARVLAPTAGVAAQLHEKGLHHRDLYLCHFFVRETGQADVRLIDAARVKRLPGWFLRQRWIVKDLAQFWYSMRQLGVMAELRRAWLEAYAAGRKVSDVDGLQRAVERKAAWIARHDARLRRKEPGRNVSIPG
jgi:hypothetical protein